MAKVNEQGSLISKNEEAGNVTNLKQKSLNILISKMQAQIAKALPSVITPERFTRIVMTAISNNPQLADCTQSSFIGAMMQAAQLGVEPNTPLGQAYLIPYKNHGVLECQFQLGYKGVIDLAYRSGEVSIIDAQAVHENDDFQFELGLEPKLKLIPAKSNRGKTVSYYAMFKTKQGGYGFQVMSESDVREFASVKSQAYKGGYSSPWKTDFDEMAKKTVLKKTLKYAPLKSDFVRALAMDETIKTELAADMADVKDETEHNTIDVEATVEQNNEAQQGV